MLVALHHVTHYRYDRLVALGPQVMRLRPAPHCRTRIASYSLKVTPSTHFVNWQQDPHGNWLARFVFHEKTDVFKIEVDLTADLAVINPFDFFIEPYAEEFPFAYPDELKAELAAYLESEPADPSLIDFVQSLSTKKMRTVDFLVDLNARLQSRDDRLRDPHGARRANAQGENACEGFRIVPRFRVAFGAGATPVGPRRIEGSCRAILDPAQARCRLRSKGPKGTASSDFTDLHAWAEVYVPGAGWIGLDATSGLFCGEGHLPLCATPHYRSAAPIVGAVDPAKVDSALEMKVTRDSAGAARDIAVLGRGLDRSSARLGDQVDRRSRRRRDAPDHGRRADLRLDRRLPVGGMEHRGRRADQARVAPTR